MKKNIYILSLLILFSCSKQTEIILPVDEQKPLVNENVITLKKDTLLKTTWDIDGAIFRPNGFKILGTSGSKGIIAHAILELNPFVHYFDTTISLINCRTKELSIMNYGADPANTDNYNEIQKTINTCINNFPCYVPAGSYRTSKPLKVYSIYKGQYVGAKLDLYGNGDLWSNSTEIFYTGKDSFAIGYQYAKGGSLHGISFRGIFKTPTGITSNLTRAQFSDPNCKASGIVVDYDGTKNSGGSTGLRIDDTWVSNFECCYNISPNGVTFNADVILIGAIRGEYCLDVFRSSQAQEKGDVIEYIASWYPHYTLINIGNYGKRQGGAWHIKGGNDVGSIQAFNINMQGWNKLDIEKLEMEETVSLGIISTGDSQNNPPVNLENLNVRFATNAGKQTLLTGNSYNVNINKSLLRYYGAPKDTLHFKGKMTFDEITKRSFTNPYTITP